MWDTITDSTPQVIGNGGSSVTLRHASRLHCNDNQGCSQTGRHMITASYKMIALFLENDIAILENDNAILENGNAILAFC